MSTILPLFNHRLTLPLSHFVSCFLHFVSHFIRLYPPFDSSSWTSSTHSACKISMIPSLLYTNLAGPEHFLVDELDYWSPDFDTPPRPIFSQPSFDDFVYFSNPFDPYSSDMHDLLHCERDPTGFLYNTEICMLRQCY